MIGISSLWAGSYRLCEIILHENCLKIPHGSLSNNIASPQLNAKVVRPKKRDATMGLWMVSAQLKRNLPNNTAKAIRSCDLTLSVINIGNCFLQSQEVCWHVNRFASHKRFKV